MLYFRNWQYYQKMLINEKMSPKLKILRWKKVKKISEELVTDSKWLTLPRMEKKIQFGVSLFIEFLIQFSFNSVSTAIDQKVQWRIVH